MEATNSQIKQQSSQKEEGDRSAALERFNLIFVILGALISVYFRDRALTLSFLAGGLLTILNFRLLRTIVKHLTGGKKFPGAN